MLKRAAMSVAFAAVLVLAVKVFADPTPKYTVDHKGNLICVDGESLGGHLGHGDEYYYEGCGEDH